MTHFSLLYHIYCLLYRALSYWPLAGYSPVTKKKYILYISANNTRSLLHTSITSPYHSSDPYKAPDGKGYFRIYFQVPVQ